MTKKITFERNLNKFSEINMNDLYKYNKEREEKEFEKYNQEIEAKKERVEKLNCPACKSIKKSCYRKYESNGVMGPGGYSKIVEEYYICQNCGIHYSDLNKKEINKPNSFLL